MHGAGNDFIVSDYGFQNEREIDPQFLNEKFIACLCDRRRGIGGDGLILIAPPSRKVLSEHKTSFSIFKMIFFNSDGSRAEMCGNGLRCASLYVNKYLTGKREVVLFETDSGILSTKQLSDTLIKIQIPILEQPQKVQIDSNEYFTVNTGVPHLIAPVKDVSSLNIVRLGRQLRFLDCFAPEGVNVDFITIPEKRDFPVEIRTYERGVEDETSACGTGIAASAAVLARFYSFSSPIGFMTKDKDVMTIDFSFKENIVEEVSNIYLTGPASEVFSGVLNEI